MRLGYNCGKGGEVIDRKVDKQTEETNQRMNKRTGGNEKKCFKKHYQVDVPVPISQSVSQFP